MGVEVIVNGCSTGAGGLDDAAGEATDGADHGDATDPVGAGTVGSPDAPGADAPGADAPGAAEPRADGPRAGAPWASWAVPSLIAAAELLAAGPSPAQSQAQAQAQAHAQAQAGFVGGTAGASRLLLREWFLARLPGRSAERALRSRRPLLGIYRTAHAGSARRRRDYDVVSNDRHDVVGRDGWWRTWGTAWTPPHGRLDSVRVLISAEPARVGDVVSLITGALLEAPTAWSLGCPTDPRRLVRAGAVVLDLPDLESLPDELLSRLTADGSLLAPVVSPLCLAIAPGVAIAYEPRNGMTFGEHRCHLLALGMRHYESTDELLVRTAATFRAHGVDPAKPHRSVGRGA